MHFSSILVAAGLAASVSAHADHLSSQEIARRSGMSRRCADAAGIMNKKRHAKRMAKRSLEARANSTVVITTEKPFYETIQNDTCILSPEVTTGPYLYAQSQTLRQDMTENQVGVPLELDIGVMDMATCEPLPNVLVDLWHCNATGSYSSFTQLSPNTPFVELLTQLNINESDYNIGVTDLHTDDSTWLRGMWPSDQDGMLEMKTIFPGFYVQRAIHIHTRVYTNWTLHSNGTVATRDVVSTGQLFVNETIATQIMALEPYVSHTEINRTTIAEDTLYPHAAKNGYYPVLSIVPTDGENIENGMVGYITIGVDTTAIETTILAGTD
ncbi:protocatechuate-dioxygenase beta subunit protein [Coleophoma cylindrospora]|uniref:Protocatechuate-dioxygenase beta subunit protein n=1 Tax=Coleophoma cylindrospora TaxID=1849047 RepID=A0A3D8R6T5_9HELO|nr:protocatechuate-dioxygenase beta subunit protein [Coleophoma cylindrospora]